MNQNSLTKLIFRHKEWSA